MMESTVMYSGIGYAPKVALALTVETDVNWKELHVRIPNVVSREFIHWAFPGQENTKSLFLKKGITFFKMEVIAYKRRSLGVETWGDWDEREGQISFQQVECKKLLNSPPGAVFSAHVMGEVFRKEDADTPILVEKRLEV